MTRLRDSDRPPVLAQQRFAADRGAFAGLSLSERFQRIHDTNLWGATESMSGLGSELDATAVLRARLPDLLRRFDVGTLLDAPCGDGGWIATVDLGVRVTGIDVVPDLVEALKRRRDFNRDYLLADITRDPLPQADAILCRDCLVHFSFLNIARALENFRSSGASWLITTTFPDWQTNLDCEDGDWRALNFERAPFGWDVPAELLNENCMEAGSGWHDKSLGVWRLADIAL